MATRKPSNSAPMAIHAVAKAANLSSRELMQAIAAWDLGWDASSHMKRLDDAQIREVERRLEVQIIAADAAPAESAKPAPAKKAPAKKAAPAKETKEQEPKPRRSRKADAKPSEEGATDATVKETAAPEVSKDAGADEPAKPSRSRSRRRKDESAGEDAATADATSADEADATSQAEEQAPEEVRDYASEARELLVNTLTLMGFNHPRVTAVAANQRIEIELTGREIATLVGQRNASARVDVIEALQLIVQKSLFGNDHRNGPTVVIDVLGFRKGRAEELAPMAARIAEYVKKTGKVIRVAAMNSIDRRAVHGTIGDSEGLRSESVGYGALRRLEISQDQRANRDDRRGPAQEGEGDDESRERRGRDRKESGERRQRDDRRRRDEGEAPAGEEQAPVEQAAEQSTVEETASEQPVAKQSAPNDAADETAKQDDERNPRDARRGRGRRRRDDASDEQEQAATDDNTPNEKERSAEPTPVKEETSTAPQNDEGVDDDGDDDTQERRPRRRGRRRPRREQGEDN